jgi:hypothetical protein
LIMKILYDLLSEGCWRKIHCTKLRVGPLDCSVTNP